MVPAGTPSLFYAQPTSRNGGCLVSPEELAEYDTETVRLIGEQFNCVCAAELEHEDLKARAASAKKRAETETDRLKSLIQERKEGRGKAPERSLFTDLKPAKWRSVLTDDLALPLDLTSKLVANGMNTAGEVYEQFGTIDPAADGTPLGLPLADVLAIREAVQSLIDREGMAAEAA